MLTERFGLVATEVLGSTETGGIAWRDGAGDDRRETWRPFPGVRVEVDESGRMLLDSPFLARDVVRPCACDDRVELRPDGTFVHVGRIDDVIKVAGKRLALVELERRLLGLPGVLDAAVVAEPASGGRDHRVRAAVVAPSRDPDELRAMLEEWFDPVTLPRRITSVPALPREPSGKLARARVIELLDAAGASATTDRELRYVDDRQIDDENGLEAREVMLEVPAELLYFRGHFPGFPVLPGVTQLDGIVLVQIARLWPELGHPRRLERIKFRRPIRPGDSLTLVLRRDSATGRVGFTIRRGDETCASGTLFFT
jgi:3-hydroxymyristoyl/3-hydroxydecanoyl-(acyl carrier protein) dehydratase